MKRDDLTCLILAGGAGRRMGGADKGWLDWHGRPLISWVIESVAPQCGQIVISANRNIEAYRALGFPVVSDLRADFCGPLAGIEAGLHAAHSNDVLVVPCDGPSLPADLAARLLAARGNAAAATATLAGRLNPLHSLILRDLAANLGAWLDLGERKASKWLQSIGTVPVPFDDEAEAFCNFNHPAPEPAGSADA